MARILKTPDEINQSINFSDDLRKLKTPSQVDEGVNKANRSKRKPYASVAAMIADDSIEIDEFVETVSYYDGWSSFNVEPVGGNKYIKVAGQLPTEDGGSIIYTNDGNHFKGVFTGSVVYLEQFGLTYTNGVISGDYTGVAAKAEAFANNANLGVTSSHSYNIKVGNTTEDNTTNMKAAQFIAEITKQPIILPAGVYNINEFEILGGVKILSLGEGDIEFRSDSAPIMRVKSGVIHDGTEFHGVLNCTGVAGIIATGMLLMDGDNTIVEDANFDGMRFKSPNYGCNGALIVAGNSGNTNHSWIKKWSMRNALYDGCGRMGAEFLNQSNLANITAVTIGTDAVFTATGLFDESGRTVLIEGMVGDSIIEGVNEKYFRLFNVNAVDGTFQLQRSDGTLVSTEGGTYNSGGVLRVCRGENIDLSGSIFKQVGTVNPTLGMGFSGDSAFINVDLSDCVFQDTPNFGLELVGLWGTNINGATWENCTGEPISTSNLMGYDNQIKGCKTIGRAADRIFISKQKRFKFVNNEFDIAGELRVSQVYESEFHGGAVRAQGVYAAIFDQSPDNYIHDIVLDNREASSNFSVLRFFGANSTGNLAKNVTLLKGDGGGHTDEAGGAAGNLVRDYRTIASGDFTKGLIINTPTGGFGSVSSFDRLPYSNTRVLNAFSAGSGYLYYRIKHLITTGNGQKQALFKFSWNGRDGNLPLGGEFCIAFGSFDVFNAAPSFWQQGDTVTLQAVQIDGSGQPYWDVTLPSNSGFLITSVEAYVRNDSDASEFEITLGF